MPVLVILFRVICKMFTLYTSIHKLIIQAICYVIDIQFIRKNSRDTAENLGEKTLASKYM